MSSDCCTTLKSQNAYLNQRNENKGPVLLTVTVLGKVLMCDNEWF